MSNELPSKHSELGSRDLIALLFKAEQLFRVISKGGYGERDRVELKALLNSIRGRAGMPDRQIAQLSGVSLTVLKNVYQGGQPKLQNFLALTYGCREAILKMLIECGAVTSTSTVDGGVYVKLNHFTNRGKLDSLAVQLASFVEDLRGRNDNDDLGSTISREALIDILRNIIKQLESPVIDLHGISSAKSWLVRFSKSVTGNLERSAASGAANSIIKLISDLFT